MVQFTNTLTKNNNWRKAKLVAATGLEPLLYLNQTKSWREVHCAMPVLVTYYIFRFAAVNRPFHLHLDFWKSRSWEIKVCLSPGFFSGLWYKFSFFLGGDLEKKSTFAGPEIFLRFEADLDFQKSRCRLKGRLFKNDDTFVTLVNNRLYSAPCGLITFDGNLISLEVSSNFWILRPDNKVFSSKFSSRSFMRKGLSLIKEYVPFSFFKTYS